MCVAVTMGSAHSAYRVENVAALAVGAAAAILVLHVREKVGVSSGSGKSSGDGRGKSIGTGSRLLWRGRIPAGVVAEGRDRPARARRVSTGHRRPPIETLKELAERLAVQLAGDAQVIEQLVEVAVKILFCDFAGDPVVPESIDVC